MRWYGKELETVGDLMDIILKITKENDPITAARFLYEYRAENKTADSNIRYLIGYIEPKELRSEAWRIFNIK